MNVSPMRTNQTHPTLSPSGGFVVFAASLIAATVSGSAFSQSSGVRLWGDNSSNQCTAIPAALTNPTRITGGNYHTIALDASGTVFCWGRNTDGQSNVPAALGVVQAIAGGSYHSVALKADGTVACWGPTGVFNSITNPNQFNQCAVPAGLTGVTAITAGWKHTLVLKSNGSIVGWGTNDSGQLTTPTDVGVVSKIAAGSRHNLVLRTNGTVRAWGRNVEQQAPSLLSYTNVTAIAAGASHSIALIADGTLRCWGNNLNGQCNGSTYTGIVGIAAGSAHTVALKSDGTVGTFGLASSSSLPTNPPLSFATGIGSGGLHTAAITLAAPSVVVVSTTPTTCRGNMGAIDATVTNATTTTWTGPNGFTASTVDLSNIFAGNYVLTATGAGGTTVVPVTVVNTPDIILPVVASYSTSLTAAAGENCTVPVANFAATVIASDNCTASGALVITQSPAAGSSVGLGLNTVVITVRDESNNQVSVNATFNVTGHSTVCYRDFDTDTFGNPAISGFFCIAPLGYVANGDDCDDGNSFVHPGQDEQCNDDDDDCDNFVDEDLPTYDYYIDVDHDGFGDGRIRITVCSPTAPAGYVTDGTDCNDANATVYPGAVETCANIAIDNDCDGSSAESEAIDRVTFYADADTDGAGDPAVSLLACSAPAGYVANSNDQCPTVHDLIEKAVYYRDFDGDGFGDRNTSAAVCSTTAPAGQVAVAGDCDDAQFLYADNDGDTYGAGQPTACGRPSNTDCNDANAAINPGATEICDVANTDENCNNLADNDDSGAADAGKTNFYRDADNDTYSVNAASRFCDLPTGYEVAPEGDCNDTPIIGAAIYPGAPELCADSTIDNNCDGFSTSVDTDAADKVDFFRDQDLDTYSINVTDKFCPGTTNPGWKSTLSNPVDCNDLNLAVYPGAVENCANLGTDNDCDGSNAESEAIDLITFYADTDLDGCGDPANSANACSVPAGYVANSTDGCPADGAKCSAGTCGCGVADTDSDSDGTADCNDGCPNDANKTAPGTCGCGVADTDSDGDGTANCNDGCPNDSNKTTPGTCGCGVADTDSDGNGSPDCADFVLSLDPQCIAVRSGNTLCVQVASTWPAFRAPDRVTGVQLAVEFDATRLRLDDVVNAITGGPFDLELDQRIDNTLGTLRYAAGINLNADPVAPGMTAAAPIVNLNFTVLDGLSDCSATGLVELVSNLGVVRTKFSTESAGDVVVRIPVLTAMPIIALDFAQPVIEGLPAAISIPTDAGVLTGGTYAQPTVTATDICDSAADLSMLITYPDSTTSTTWPANDLFPNNPSDANGGISTVVYTAVDDAGNTATATLVVTVGNFQHFNANITLGGTILGNSVRPIVLTVDSLAPQTVHVSMVRANGAIVDLHVPVAVGYGCTTAKDDDHSLAQVSMTTIVNREYATSFTLRQGNSNHDSQIDIFDFSLFVFDRSTGTSAAVATNARSNFNSDTLVTNADFGFLTLNFFEVDQTCGGNVAGASSAPVSRVSIKELRRRGLGNLAVADINGDGWVDLNDVQLYMQGAGQAPAGVDTTRGRPATRW